MGDATIAETRAELKAILRDGERKRRLYALAKGFARGPDTADDLVHTACVKLLSGATPWRRETHPDLVAHLGSVMFTHSDNVRTSADARRQRKFHTPEEEDRVVDARPGAQQQLLDDEAERRAEQKLGRWLHRLREKSAGDDEVLALVGCFERQILTPAQQVEDTGWDIDDVRRVRKRLFERAEVVMRDNPDDSDQYVARGAES